jgi:hypothetical protein
MAETNSGGSTKDRALQASYELADLRPSDRRTLSVMDSGETADFVCQTMVDREVRAVTYLVTLRASGGDAWSTVRAQLEGHGGRQSRR